MTMGRVDGRRGGEQRAGIGVRRVFKDVLLGPLLDRAAEVHHHHFIGNMAHDAEVVGNEEIGEIELLLQVHQQVQDLRLDRDVQGRYRLVRHQDSGPQHQGAGNRDSLALPAREHVRIAVIVLGPQTDLRQHFLRLLSALGG